MLPPTEQRHPLSNNLDELATLEMVRLMNRLDATIPLVIAEVLPQIAQVIDLMVATLAAEGRVFYQGAGTSGRLAVLDAAELLPTFGIPPGQVLPLLAGGPDALIHSIEGAEDDETLGKHDLLVHHFGAHDMLIGIAASGRTPYVLGGLRYAQECGARSAVVVCTPDSPMAAAVPIAIELVTGPEVLTGSTRLRAGTAQKMVLNMLSTCSMVKLGKAYGNLMVDVQPTNRKLRQRAIRIVCEATGITPEAAQRLLDQADWQVKTAVVMGLIDVDAPEARHRLTASNGHVRQALHLRSDHVVL
jgi:N-acetylmuramic acid 6-phosphate etherase